MNKLQIKEAQKSHTWNNDKTPNGILSVRVLGKLQAVHFILHATLSWHLN